MLYLASEKGQRTIKVGWTERPAGRMNDYAKCSTVTQFIDWMEGTQTDEREWHEYMDALGFEKVFPERERSEWYYMPDYIDKRKLMKDGFEYLTNVMDAFWRDALENL